MLLFGASPDTKNLGVSALMESVVRGFADRQPDVDVVVADNGNGLRRGRPDLVGIRRTRRYYRPESMFRVDLATRLGGLANDGARAILRSSAILDISGGDSFTDLYGAWRFQSVTWAKRMALRLRKTLILLPQTYGPFREPSHHDQAAKLVRHARRAWARDARSYVILRELLGPEFDPARHRLGVDVAFLLPRVGAARLLKDAAPGEVGVNVSGLIWNNPEAARDQYRFKADYRHAMSRIVAAIAADAPVVLVPHVVTPPGHYESDRAAAEALVETLPASAKSHVRVSPDPDGPCDAKELIASCSWFLGTRMHATIAALSSGVPCAAVSYSDKTLGVFETCGQGEHVHDPRVLETDALVERVVGSFKERAAARVSLAGHLPGVLARADDQMNEIVRVVRESAAEPAARSRA